METKPSRSRYTPQEFADWIYEAPSEKHLNFRASDTEIYSERDIEDWKNVTLYASPSTDHKKLTVEFRQHEATVDAIAIKWWIMFCGILLDYAYLLIQ